MFYDISPGTLGTHLVSISHWWLHDSLTKVFGGKSAWLIEVILCTVWTVLLGAPNDMPVSCDAYLLVHWEFL